ncbi:DUF6702 family protein [uncultured Polaribacter sp.]|uniref:DUF6702 family protein n=1 Tax=uncultured Polaribacter sp. TaxID=174711 RepID=UPI002629966B|nr:DUF6702 family protein [uncultured Polaribacter sp.]
MKIKKIYLLLLLIPLISFTVHKYYLSLTQIKYKSEAKSVQIITNVFMDDIEEALNQKYFIDLQISTKKELENNDVYFEKYLKENLFFKIDNVPREFTYLGKEYEDDLIYFYLEIENVESVNDIEITNKILINHFPKQQNLVKSKVGKKNKSFLLTKEKFITTLKH